MGQKKATLIFPTKVKKYIKKQGRHFLTFGGPPGLLFHLFTHFWVWKHGEVTGYCMLKITVAKSILLAYKMFATS